MYCRQNNVNRVASSGHCVKDILKNIYDAQKKVADRDSTTCATSCQQSIDDLLSPHAHHRPRRHTTIPVSLFDHQGKPFVGSGFTRHHRHMHCIESTVFRVRGFTNNNCVQLELLKPIYETETPTDARCESTKSTACHYFDNRPIRNFRKTGLCITVDMSCFCGVTCLDPITPQSN